MILVALVLVAALGALVSAAGMAQGGRAARWGVIAGGVALLVVMGLAFALDPAEATGDTFTGRGLAFDGAIVASGFLRLVVGLWALESLVLLSMAGLLGGMAGLRGLLPATLVAIAAGTISMAATNLAVGVAAATAAGLASLLVIFAVPGPAAVMAGARELRATLLGGAVVLVVLVALPVAAQLVLFGLGGAAGGDGTGEVLGNGGEAGALMGLLMLAGGVAVAVRYGMLPFHVRVSRLTDLVQPAALPLLLAWLPLPLAVAAIAAVDTLVSPLALSLDGERLILILVSLATLAGAALAAFSQDDLRHTLAYLVVADAGLIGIAVAALDSAAWGPSRVWVVTLAVTKTALAAWTAVTEDRFETRSIPDLRGWIRKAPILAAGLLVTVVATYGLPGWVVFESRGALAAGLGDGPLGPLVVIAGFLSLPVYVRLVVTGFGRSTSHVDGAPPERMPRAPRWARQELLAVEEEPAGGREAAGTPTGSASAEDGTVDAVVADPARARAAGRRGLPAIAMPIPVAARTAVARYRPTVAGLRSLHLGGPTRRMIKRDRAELLSVAVVTLAVLAALTSWGMLDIAHAAAEPAPIAAGAIGN